MAIRRILKYGQDDILHKKSRPVGKIDKRILQLLDDMVETMRSAEGVGLAAPQVGVLRRVVVIDVGDGLIELINPEIIENDGQQQGPEGCLSIPGVVGQVIRPERVKVKALNRKGEEFEVDGTGLLARALCHEIDHLNGVLFIEKAIPDTLEGE
ncbi:MAG: peptide deformylase [Clostridiales bacterium]|jgi:peptide deformylase|nr:peptide deformylase [Clostridiales bacterium]